MSDFNINIPLHGMTLESILNHFVNHYGSGDQICVNRP
ncbi:MAG: VF530 family protein [Candidatus Thiodiazotropha sp. (ex Codakia rugifera)]|nr:VF530 family protein [Candidatus Thiodiazotropha sp. (ex Codakia rugifera)]